jgi:hypothetical protein
MKGSNEDWLRLSCQAYLHLPAKFAALNVVPDESGNRLYAHGAQVIRPDMFQDLSNFDRARFTKALKALDLEVGIHLMSFSPELDSSKKGKGSDDGRLEKESRASRLEGSQWPMRIQVMKIVFDYYE